MGAALIVVLCLALRRTTMFALMPDLFPSALRSKVNAITNIMSGIGGILAEATSLRYDDPDGDSGNWIRWADPPSNLVFAFLCNRFLPLEAAHLRFQELAEALWSCVSMLEEF